MQKLIDVWIDQAQHDLQAAEANLKIHYPDVCLILCEQAVEKILKAFYIKKFQKEPPKTHNLDILINELGLYDELEPFIVQIDQYYFVLRYPSQDQEAPYKLVDEQEAGQGLEKAKTIFNSIKEKLI